MYDVGGKLLNGIKSIYVNSLACVIVKGGESKCFKIYSGMRQGCIMSPGIFNVYIYGCNNESGETEDGKEGSEISLFYYLFALLIFYFHSFHGMMHVTLQLREDVENK